MSSYRSTFSFSSKLQQTYKVYRSFEEKLVFSMFFFLLLYLKSARNKNNISSETQKRENPYQLLFVCVRTKTRIFMMLNPKSKKKKK